MKIYVVRRTTVEPYNAYVTTNLDDAIISVFHSVKDESFTDMECWEYGRILFIYDIRRFCDDVENPTLENIKEDIVRYMKFRCDKSERINYGNKLLYMS